MRYLNSGLRFQALARVCVTIQPQQHVHVDDYLQSTSKYSCLKKFELEANEKLAR